jgi:hypothetical protein
VDCGFERKLLPEKAGEKAERFYDATLRLVELERDNKHPNLAACSFAAGQKVKNTKVVEIKASYLIAIRFPRARTKSSEVKNLLTELARSAAWPRFRNLFIQIGSQSAAELPLLPNIPQLRWVNSKGA